MDKEKDKSLSLGIKYLENTKVLRDKLSDINYYQDKHIIKAITIALQSERDKTNRQFELLKKAIRLEPNIAFTLIKSDGGIEKTKVLDLINKAQSKLNEVNYDE